MRPKYQSTQAGVGDGKGGGVDPSFVLVVLAASYFMVQQRVKLQLESTVMPVRFQKLQKWSWKQVTLDWRAGLQGVGGVGWGIGRDLSIVISRRKLCKLNSWSAHIHLNGQLSKMFFYHFFVYFFCLIFFFWTHLHDAVIVEKSTRWNLNKKRLSCACGVLEVGQDLFLSGQFAFKNIECILFLVCWLMMIFYFTNYLL